MSDIAAVHVHVPDVVAGLSWYRRAFPQATVARSLPTDFAYLQLGGGTRIELVFADEKVATGAAGSVVYWRVDDLPAALAHLEGVGARLYRGPMRIDDDLWMCQVRDPWGNCIGIRGPKPETGRHSPA